MAWNTDLEAYAHYWGTALGYGHERAKSKMRDIREGVDGTWGSADDPLASHTPMAQNAILNRLGKLAAGRIDDWESHVDPQLSPGENYQVILEKGGEVPQEEKEAVWKAIDESMESRERNRAVNLLFDHVEAIENGEKQQLIDDIEAEYGSEFVDETLHDARKHVGLIEPAESADYGPVVTANEAETAAAEPVERAEPTAEPAGGELDIREVTRSDRPEPTQTVDVDLDGTAEVNKAGRYDGLLGSIRLLIDAVRVPFKAGYRDGQTADSAPNTTEQASLEDY